MRIDILTLFPDLFHSPLQESILKRALNKEKVKIYLHNLRDYTHDKHHKADDTPYGGGPGMVLKAPPVIAALKKLKHKNSYVIFMTPKGETLSQKAAKKLAKKRDLIIVCGHYEGLDERILSLVDTEISIGDYVLTGGEIPALVLVDTLVRLIPGVIGDEDSFKGDSFYHDLLDFPHYTRPLKVNGEAVPQALLSGNHKDILKFRRKEALKRTLFARPDLLVEADLKKSDAKIITEILKEA